MDVDPDKLRIVHYPDPVLETPARPVEAVDEVVRAVADRMIELMYEAEGIGLAAPQVGLPWRLFVADVPAGDGREIDPEDGGPPTATGEPMVCINPVLSEHARNLVPFEEGCLSLPGITGEVRRPSEVTIEALDAGGEAFRRRGRDLLARCWQHEYDHLDGVLILSRFTQRARLKNRSAIKQLSRGTRRL